MRVKSYLQFCRLHTAPLEMSVGVVGALLATGGDITSGVFVCGLFSLLYHAAGYSMNSYSDWKNGYDKADEDKQHHPLNNGSMEDSEAWTLTIALFCITLIIGLLVAGTNVYAGSALAIMIIAGLVYNYFGKDIGILKPVPISIAHSMVFVVCYLGVGGSVNPTFYGLWAVVFLWVLFQIGISGEVKDMDKDEYNILESIGCRVEHRSVDEMGNTETFYYFSITAGVLSWLIKTAMLLASIGVLMYNTRDWIPYGAVWAIYITSSFFEKKMLEPSTNGRQNRITYMSAVEGLSLCIFTLSTVPVIGWGLAASIICGSIIWVVVFNKIEWGTIVAPTV